MKALTVLASLALLQTACGSESQPDLQKSYSIDTNLKEPNQVRLSFQKSYNYRNIAVGFEQSNDCKAFAREYDLANGTDLKNTSFKVTFDNPVKHCTKRNALKQCESTAFIYTFHCTFEAK